MKIALLFFCVLSSIFSITASALSLESQIERILESKMLKGDDLRNFLAIKDTEPYLGAEPKEAKAVVVMYGSLTCAHCAHTFMLLADRLKNKYWNSSNKAVTLVHRSFVGDQLALMATKLLTCNHVPKDKHYQLLRTLYHTQDSWTQGNCESNLCEIASTFGISQQQFMECNNPSLTREILKSRIETIEKLGLKATPMFFVNGVNVKELGVNNIISAIESELSKNNLNRAT